MVVANTVAVPLQFILFTVKIPFFNEVKSDSHFLNWVACAITVAGLVCYQWVQEGGDEVKFLFITMAPLPSIQGDRW